MLDARCSRFVGSFDYSDARPVNDAAHIRGKKPEKHRRM